MIKTNEVQLKQFHKIEEANSWLRNNNYEFLGFSCTGEDDINRHWIVVAYRRLN